MAFLFWGIIAVVFGVIWLATLLVFIASRFIPSNGWRWAGFLPFAATTSCALWFVGSIYFLSTPPQVFKTSFGFAPTNDVREIKSKYWYFGDTGITYLKFKANPETIKRIVTLGLVEAGSTPSQSSASIGDDVPDWWRPESHSGTRIYTKSNRIRDFASEEEMLCYDETAQQAYYSFQGID